MNLANVRLLKRLFAERLTDAQIAREMKLKPSMVKSTRHEYGLLRRRPPIDPDEVVAMHLAGLDDDTIAQRLACSPDTVRVHRCNAGHRKPPKPLVPYVHPRRDPSDLAVAMMTEGATDDAVAAAEGVSRTIVRRWRRERGIVRLGGHPRLDGAEIRRRFTAGEDDATIASAVGSTPASIRQWRHKHGLYVAQRGVA